ncbi:MAG: transglycosylase SLT domain-containing protein, partial [Proteobacteria bacterium]|nr:transglycosylase SLT domain-containing protein [Pseudomonadota bacterium]
MKTLIRMICLGVLAAALPGPSPARANPAQAFDNAWNLCRLETARTERRMAIPRYLLTAISLAESGRRDDVNGVNVAWPWTVTSGGQGRFFDTKAEALAEVEILMTQGVRNIDVGCMQVNLFYHGSAFETLDEAFDPRANTTYAATYLKTMHAATGDWTEAAGYYHSTTPERNGPYKEKVLTFWRRQGGGPSDGSAVAARTPGT